MALTYPLFLFALFALAIPIIIHLFQFRRYKTLYFPDITLLKAVQQETTSRSRLKHLLVLICRLLALAALALAFCRPFIPGETTGKQHTEQVSIYIDNSFSMQGHGESGPLVESAKQMAFEIARNYSPGTQFQLITNDFAGRQQLLYSQDDLIRMIDEVDISSASRTLNEVAARQAEALGTDSSHQVVYWISDFRENVVDSALNLPGHYNYRPIQLSAEQSANISVDSVWFDLPVQRVNTEQPLWFRISNYSDEAKSNVPVSLEIDGQSKGVMTLSLAPHQQLDTFISISTTVPGWHQGEISIEDYPVVFDDTYFFSFHSQAIFTVTELHGQDVDESPFEKLFAVDENIDWQKNPANNPDFSRLRESSLIILNGVPEVSSGLSDALQDAVSEGGNVLLAPPSNADRNSWNTLLANLGLGALGTYDTSRMEVSFIERQHHLYKGVFTEWPENVNLPFVNHHFKMGEKGSMVMRLANGDPLVMNSSSKNGSAYLIAVPAESEKAGNFFRHALFVPTVYNMAIATSKAQEPSFWLGHEPFLAMSTFRGNQEDIKMEHVPSGGNFIPETRYATGGLQLFTYGQASAPGSYKVLANDSTLSVLALNHHREESQLRPPAMDRIENYMKGSDLAFHQVKAENPEEISAQIQSMDLGKELWPLFILAALICFILEIVFLKLNR